mgnify:CR=1 FL=1|jgi:hypothetical protein
MFVILIHSLLLSLYYFFEVEFINYIITYSIFSGLFVITVKECYRLGNELTIRFIDIVYSKFKGNDVLVFLYLFVIGLVWFPRAILFFVTVVKLLLTKGDTSE